MLTCCACNQPVDLPDGLEEKRYFVSNCKGLKCEQSTIFCLHRGCDHSAPLTTPNTHKYNLDPEKYFLRNHYKRRHGNAKKRKTEDAFESTCSDTNIDFCNNEFNQDTPPPLVNPQFRYDSDDDEEEEEEKEEDIVDDVHFFDENLVHTSMVNQWNQFSADMQDSSDLFLKLLDDEEYDFSPDMEYSNDLSVKLLDDDEYRTNHEMTHNTNFEFGEETEEMSNNDANFVTLVDKHYDQLVLIYDKRTDEEKKQRKNGTRNNHCPISLYFSQQWATAENSENCRTGGYQGLVWRAVNKNLKNKYKCSSKEDTVPFFLLHKLILSLSQSDHELLLDYDREKCKLFGITEEELKRVQLPKSGADIRNMISRGKYSIMKNIPHQRVFTIDNHACVSLRDTFCLMAGYFGGFQFAWDGRTRSRNTEGLNGTQGVGELIKEICEGLLQKGHTKDEIAEWNLGYIFFWSDSFLRCFIKQKENSVWIMTLTICSPKEKLGKYSFVIAMGKSKNDHSRVIEHFHREANDMKKGFPCYYGGNVNEVRMTAVGVSHMSCDRPERKAVDDTRQEGYWGLVSNHAVYINPKYYPACASCHKDIVKEAVIDAKPSHTSKRCIHCLAWIINSDAPRWMYYQVSSDYPVNRLMDRRSPPGREPGARHLGPVRLSSDFMVEVCSYAYEARRTGIWSKANMIEYLTTCNIKDYRIEIIDNCARYDKIHKKNSTPKDYLLGLWFIVDLWRRHYMPDIPMHAIAHGMIPDSMDVIHAIFSSWRKFSDFVKYCNSIIVEVASFGLDWCKLKSMPKASWMAENKMAYARLMPYLHGMYFLNGGRVTEEQSLTVIKIKRFINSLHTVLSYLMSPKETDVDRFQALFKLLMSSVHCLEKDYQASTNDSNTKPGETTGKGRGFIHEMDLEDVLNVLRELKMPFGNSAAIMRKSLNNIKKNRLETILSDRGVKYPNSASKEQLQILLFENILGSHNIVAQPLSKRKDEKCIWKKGAWLSLMANYRSQIGTHGNVRFLW